MSIAQKKERQEKQVAESGKDTLRAALIEAQRGDRKRAHLLLQMACRREPNNEQAWLWRASLTADLAESTECMKEVLRINRDNKIAQQWLVRHKDTEKEEESYECPFCGRSDPQDFYRCPDCNAVVNLDLELMKDLSEVNVSQIEQSIEGFAYSMKNDPFNMHFWSAVGYMNLFRSELAMTHLLQAHYLQPTDIDVEAALEKLKRRKLILVVDDSATIRSLVTRVLEKNGCRTLEAASGTDALGFLDQKDIAGVILDIGMPGLDGYKVCRMMREHPRTAKVPIIMLSGNDGFFDKVRGKLAGSTDYLTKPLRPNMLMASIHKHIEQ